MFESTPSWSGLGRGLTAMLAAGAVAAGPVLVAAPAAGVTCTAQVAERAEALRVAEACDLDVVISGETTSWSTVKATPAGTVLLEVSAAARRTRFSPHAPGEWSQIDTRFNDLDPADGRVDVTAPVSPMSISDGGKGQPLAMLGGEQGTVVLDVPFALPAPVLDGAAAVYEAVAGEGVDLLVRVTPDGTGLVPSLRVASEDAWRQARDELSTLDLTVSTTEGLSVTRSGDGFGVTDLAGQSPWVWTEPVAIDADADLAGVRAELTPAGTRAAADGRRALADLAVEAFAGDGGSPPGDQAAVEVPETGEAVTGQTRAAPGVTDQHGAAAGNGTVSGLLEGAVDTGVEASAGRGTPSDPNADRVAEAVRVDALAKVTSAGVRLRAGKALKEPALAGRERGANWPVMFGLGTVAATEAGWMSLADRRSDDGGAAGAGFLAGPELPAGGRGDADRRLSWSMSGLGEVGLSDPDQIVSARFEVPASGVCDDVAVTLWRTGVLDHTSSLTDTASAWTSLDERSTGPDCGAEGAKRISFDATPAARHVASGDTGAAYLGLSVAPQAAAGRGTDAGQGGSDSGPVARAARRSPARSTADALSAGTLPDPTSDAAMTTFAADDAVLTVELEPSAQTLEATSTANPEDTLAARKEHRDEATAHLPEPSVAPSAQTEGTAEPEPEPEPSVAPADDLPVPATATIPVTSTATTTDVGGMDVTVQAPATASAPESLDVTVEDQTVADAEGLTGVVLGLDDASATPPAGGEPAREVDVAFDYADFAEVAGAGWADRLGLLRIPACAEVTPDAPECQPEQIPTDNDAAASTVSATVELPTAESTEAAAAFQDEGATSEVAGDLDGPAASPEADEAGSASTKLAADEPSPPSAGDRYALVSGTQSDAGNWGATPLSTSSSWSVSGSTGSFSWSYPLGVPKPSGGPSPDLSLGYSTAGLDGMVTDSNTQSSAVGLGWDMTSGFIERRFLPCGQDTDPYPGSTTDPNNADRETGDLCWGPADAVSLVFNGHSSELIRDGGVWRPKNDDGTRVKLLTGASNRDDDGEYWVVTTTDGVQYYFGKDERFAGDTLEQNSAWTVPVYGNHAGEPGHATKFADSEARQAWRWNLDYVVDPAGRSMSYVYAWEQNRYGADLNRDGAKLYERGGRLDHIRYGSTVSGDEAGAVAPYRVDLSYAERCLAGVGCEPGDLYRSTAWRWHDTPTDLSCTSSTSCKQVMSPAFFTRKRLTAVTTKVRDGGAYQGVDTYTLKHRWKDPGDGTNRVLWLQSITRQAVDDTPGSSAALEEDDVAPQKVWFTSTNELPGRVEDTVNDGWPVMNRVAISGVTTATGSHLTVNYRTPQCTDASTPDDPTLAEQKANTQACFPVTWTPVGEDDEVTEWFHKHLVEGIVQNPGEASNQVTVETAYTYSGGAHWARTPSALSPLKDINYADFRGFERAATITGRTEDDSPRQKVTTEYFRGTGDTLTAALDGGVNAVDNERFAGMPFRTTVYNGAAGDAKPVSVTVNKHTQARTATNPGWDDRSGETADDTHARRLESSTAWKQVLRADGTTTSSTTRTRSEFNAYGQVIEVDDAGGIGTSTDDLCTTTSYIPNTTDHLRTTIKQTRTVAAACGSTGKLVAAQQIAYDGGAVGAAPTRGLPTRSLMPDPADPPAGAVGESTALSWTTAQRVTYESGPRARPRFVYDALDRMSETTYQDNAAGVPIGMTTYSPDPDGTGPVTRHATTTVLDVLRGVPLTVTDPNGKVTTAKYDNLGRLLKVWQPDRDTSLSPSVSYTYTVRASGINAVRTSVLPADGGDKRHESSTLYDGLLRPIQTQAESADPAAPGRAVTDTIYDHAGRVYVTLGEWYVPGSASDKFLTLASNDVVPPSAVVFDYDGAGRQTAERFYNGNIDNPDYELWRTTTAYDGKFTSVTPPEGGTPTTTMVDARGRMIELRQHTGDSDSDGRPDVGGTYQATTYERDPEGRLAEVVETTTKNGAGQDTAVWTYGYDVLGRQVTADDPDRGTTTTVYDVAGQTLAVTDANGDSLGYKYDALGRKTGMFDATVTGGNVSYGAQRAGWVFDRLTDPAGTPGSTIVKGQATASVRHEGGHEYVTSVTGYDDAYRPTGSVVHLPGSNTELGGLAGDYETSYTYMADGQVESVTLPAAGGLGQETVTTHFDESSLPEWMGGGFGWGTYVAASGRTIYGEQSWLDLGNTYAAVVSYQYDEATRRLENIALDRERINGTDLDVTYTYDAAGNILSQTDVPGVEGLEADGQCFDYDAPGRLTEAWTPAVTGVTADCGAAKDVATLAGPAPYWDTWAFEGNGNRESWTHRTPDGDTTTTYEYDPASPHRVTGVAVDAPSATITEAFTYDAAGNTTGRTTTSEGSAATSTGETETRTATQELTFDPESELTGTDTGTSLSVQPAEPECEVPDGEDPEIWCEGQTGSGAIPTVTDEGTLATENIYSADGDRLVRITRAAATSGGTPVVTGVTAYVGGGQELTLDATGEATAARYYSFAGQTVAVRTGKGMKNVSTLIADHHGTPLASVPNTDWATETVIRHHTTPYGAARSADQLPGDHRFLGKTRDTSTGYTLVGARWYDETLGRFLTVDPIMDLTDPQQWHGYTYANNTPVTLSDPAGLEPREWHGEGNPMPDPGDVTGRDDDGAPRTGGSGGSSGAGSSSGADSGGGDASGPSGGSETVADTTGTTASSCYDSAPRYTGSWMPISGITACAIGETSQEDPHFALDMAGTVPVVGEPFDAANCGLYTWKGESVDAAISCGAMVPLAGDAGKLGRMSKRIADSADNGRKFCSFAGSTLVLMADGTRKPIEDIEVGDEVIATDPETGEQGAREVTHVWVHQDNLFEFEVDGKLIVTTEDHPFWSVTDQTWEDAQRLDRGERVLTADGRAKTVTREVDFGAREVKRAYNLTVAGLHTYHVGHQGILVHNADDGLTPEQRKSVRSYEALIEEHESKLRSYLADPDAHDNKGYLRNAPNDEVRQKIIESRARHLRKEIETFRNNINKITGGC
ncbi:polymorphic toxin-type HINT domain-containing protein [Myceligenerans cantabricum]